MKILLKEHIPFELLLEKEITYLESGRDLIIRANEECGNGAIIIGNPYYWAGFICQQNRN